MRRDGIGEGGGEQREEKRREDIRKREEEKRTREEKRYKEEKRRLDLYHFIKPENILFW